MNQKYQILIREKEDWGNLTLRQLESNLKAKEWGDEQIARFFKNIHRFNKAFSISFFDYRKELFEICKFNWRRLGIDWIVFKDLKSLQNNKIYLLTDDDDWFAPNVLQKIEATGCDNNIFCWKTLKINCDNRNKVYSRFTNDQDSHKVASNGYAIKNIQSFDRELIGDHRVVDNYRHKLVIPQFLSVKVNTPSCRFFLCNRENINTAVPDLAALEIPNQFQRFSEEIRMLNSLNKRLFAVRNQIFI